MGCRSKKKYTTEPEKLVAIEKKAETSEVKPEEPIILEKGAGTSELHIETGKNDVLAPSGQPASEKPRSRGGNMTGWLPSPPEEGGLPRLPNSQARNIGFRQSNSSVAACCSGFYIKDGIQIRGGLPIRKLTYAGKEGDWEYSFINSEIWIDARPGKGIVRVITRLNPENSTKDIAQFPGTKEVPDAELEKRYKLITESIDNAWNGRINIPATPYRLRIVDNRCNERIFDVNFSAIFSKKFPSNKKAHYDVHFVNISDEKKENYRSQVNSRNKVALFNIGDCDEAMTFLNDFKSYMPDDRYAIYSNMSSDQYTPIPEMYRFDRGGGSVKLNDIIEYINKMDDERVRNIGDKYSVDQFKKCLSEISKIRLVIDRGNFITEAHEYGHMIGLPDEYEDEKQNVGGALYKFFDGTPENVRSIDSKGIMGGMAFEATELRYCLPIAYAVEQILYENGHNVTELDIIRGDKSSKSNNFNLKKLWRSCC